MAAGLPFALCRGAPADRRKPEDVVLPSAWPKVADFATFNTQEERDLEEALKLSVATAEAEGAGTTLTRGAAVGGFL